MSQLLLFNVPVPVTPTSQVCNDCGQLKPLSGFQLERRRTEKEGSFYKHRCKECCKKLGSVQRFLGKLHKVRLYYEQGGRCAHCDRPEVTTGRGLGLDHCRFTGRVRGLLCMPCNTAVGLLGLDCPPEELDGRLARLAAYLKGTPVEHALRDASVG